MKSFLSLALLLVVLSIAPAQPWNHFDPLAIEGKGYPGQIPVTVQVKGDQIPGIWMCKDKNGDTVFSNRTGQYKECRPYVASPGLREAFLKEMLLKRKQDAPQHVIPDQSSTKATVLGPL